MTTRQLAANPDRLTYFSTTRPAKGTTLPGFGTYVFMWSILVAGAAALTGTAVGLFLCYTYVDFMTDTLPTADEVTLWTRYFGSAFFGLFLIVSLRRQVSRWETLIQEREEQEYEPKREMKSISRPMPRPQHETASTTTYAMRPGTYPATQQEMLALRDVLESNEYRFVRDVVAKAKFKGVNVFPNITANWAAILQEWERMGYVENGVVTDSGIYWIEQNVPVGELD